jgi:hypothetical protein
MFCTSGTSIIGCEYNKSARTDPDFENNSFISDKLITHCSSGDFIPFIISDKII